MINVRLEQFEGPLDLLLQLIEQNQLDISTVSMAAVTEQYLGSLTKMQSVPPEELADFLVVAAKLLLIKSRVLLPHLQLPEEEGMSLAEQLKLYQVFVAATKHVQKLLRRRQIMFGREHVPTLAPMFSPPPKVTAADLRQALLAIVNRLEPLLSMASTTIARTVSLEEKISSIRSLLAAESAVNFHTLLRRAKSRMDVIVTFLALLELVKQRTAFVVQEENFSDIRIETSGVEEAD